MEEATKKEDELQESLRKYALKQGREARKRSRSERKESENLKGRPFANGGMINFKGIF
jgi:hypothetical protein